jgi:peptidoglycan lytic transglycosylase G
MTIRSGGRPRDPRNPRAPQAHPYEPDAYATEYVPEAFEPSRRGNPGGRGRRTGGGGSGLSGILKFLIFALVLGGLVLAIGLTVLRPVVNSAILAWAADNPGALKFDFVAELVREDLGAALTAPASTDPTQVTFTVLDGDTAATIGARLEDQGLIGDARAFVFIATDRGLTGALQQGEFLLRKNLTPDEVVTALLAPPAVPYVDIALRTGLRLEQITAKLQTLDKLEMDPRAFYELVSDPPASLIDDYPWLKRILADASDGASLEGFLWPATYRVLPDTTPDELVRLMLDGFEEAVGPDRLDVPADRGLDFYQVLTLASIVEREAVLDEERPLIAGVYQNRLDKLPGVKTGLLNADPTVIYAADTVNLDAMDFDQWQQYVFWTIPETPLAKVELPDDLAGYNSYVVPGLPPGPIATPTLVSIDAALAPSTDDAYIYFLAIPDGNGAHVFAKTKKEHDANRAEYGYQ